MANMIKFHIYIIVLLFGIKGGSYVDFPKIEMKPDNTPYLIHYNDEVNVLTVLKEPLGVVLYLVMTVLMFIPFIVLFYGIINNATCDF